MTTAMGPKVKGDVVEQARRAQAISDAERRRAPRVLVDLEVDYASEENYLFAYITDISATGIFVRTTTPEQPGTHLNLRFKDEPRAARGRGRGDLGQPVPARVARQPSSGHGHPVCRARR